MTDDFDAWNAFRQNETPAISALKCCECGKNAQGNITCDDGPLCDDCHAEFLKGHPT